MGGTDEQTAELTIANRMGFHVRPVTRFAELARLFKADVQVSLRGRHAPGKSPMFLMSLGGNCGDKLQIRASGEDARQCMAVLLFLAENHFFVEDEPSAVNEPDRHLCRLARIASCFDSDIRVTLNGSTVDAKKKDALLGLELKPLGAGGLPDRRDPTPSRRAPCWTTWSATPSTSRRSWPSRTERLRPDGDTAGHTGQPGHRHRGGLPAGGRGRPHPRALHRRARRRAGGRPAAEGHGPGPGGAGDAGGQGLQPRRLQDRRDIQRPRRHAEGRVLPPRVLRPHPQQEVHGRVRRQPHHAAVAEGLPERPLPGHARAGPGRPGAPPAAQPAGRPPRGAGQPQQRGHPGRPRPEPQPDGLRRPQEGQGHRHRRRRADRPHRHHRQRARHPGRRRPRLRHGRAERRRRRHRRRLPRRGHHPSGHADAGLLRAAAHGGGQERDHPAGGAARPAGGDAGRPARARAGEHRVPARGAARRRARRRGHRPLPHRVPVPDERPRPDRAGALRRLHGGHPPAQRPAHHHPHGGPGGGQVRRRHGADQREEPLPRPPLHPLLPGPSRRSCAPSSAPSCGPASTARSRSCSPW